MSNALSIRKWGFVTAALAVAGGSIVPTLSMEATDHLSARALVDLYIELALGVEFGTSDRQLVKWSTASTVRVVTFPRNTIVQAGQEADVSEAVDQMVAEISAPIERPAIVSLHPDALSAGLSFTDLKPPHVVANGIQVYVGSREEALEGAILLFGNRADVLAAFAASWPSNQPVCYGWTQTDSSDPNLAVSAYVFIEYSERFEECLFEEVMQSFGLPNDLPSGSRSIFNDDNVHSRPTATDWLLWRAHFDDRLVRGMNENALRAAAEIVLLELLSP
jgi:hypothetical protein